MKRTNVEIDLLSFMSDQETKEGSNQKPSWLFSFGVSKAKARQAKNGRISFTFNKRAVSDITAFTDRPERLTGKLDIDGFSKHFDGIFADGKGKPNASVTYWKDGFENKICKVTDIRLTENRKDRYVVKAKMLTKSSAFYDQLEDVDFFVDAGSHCSCGSYSPVFHGTTCCECESPGSSQVKPGTACDTDGRCGGRYCE